MKIVLYLLLLALFSSFPTTAREMQHMQLTSPRFAEGETIPSHFTCDGQNRSPELAWAGVPQETKSFVLIVEDPDAPHGTWVHWVVFNIPAHITKLPEGAQDFPQLGTQGMNSFNKPDYGGPCPPSGTHRYYFKVYALNAMLKLPSSTTKEHVVSAMQGHILAEATLMGRYGH